MRGSGTRGRLEAQATIAIRRRVRVAGGRRPVNRVRPGNAAEQRKGGDVVLQHTPSGRWYGRPGLPDDFLFGVATAGFQVEGGYNGPGEPANNWLAWEQVGRVEPSGNAVGFWERPEESLDRAAALGCNSFRLGVEWARVVPETAGSDAGALARTPAIVHGCLDRGLEPLVTLHHFTHPAWLGDDFWLRPDAPDRFRGWAEVAVDALAPLGAPLGDHQRDQRPGHRIVAARDVPAGSDPGLRGRGHRHRQPAGRPRARPTRSSTGVRPDAVVTTNNCCMSLYDYDRLLTDLLLARSMRASDADDVDGWLDDRRPASTTPCSRRPGGRAPVA